MEFFAEFTEITNELRLLEAENPSLEWKAELIAQLKIKRRELLAKAISPEKKEVVVNL